MNAYQTELYLNLMTLCDGSDAFYFADQELDGFTYRIFNYRLASYSNFLEPAALECRGIMFKIDEEGNALELSAHPMPKFFNLNENPFTMELDLSDNNIRRIEMKADGSLMSTFCYKTTGTNTHLGIKSKGSLHSDQVKMTHAFLEKNKALADEFILLAKRGYTANMELVSPNNRIVLNYDKTDLIILNIRDNVTGKYMLRSELDDAQYPCIATKWVAEAWHTGLDGGAVLVSRAKDLTGIEGFIVYLNDGTIFKLKTEWYLVQHRAKDNVDSPRRLFEAAIEDATDDLRTLFHDNQQVIDRIVKMELFAASIYNTVVAKVEEFVEKNRKLIEVNNRKQFAINGHRALADVEINGKGVNLFGLAMNEYGMIHQPEKARPVDYKAFCLKNWREWGLKDVAEVEE